MSAAAAFGRPLSSSLPTPPLAAADDDADSWPARRRSLLAQRRELAPDDGVVVQRVALDRDAVAIAFEVVQLHELAGDQVLDEQREAARLRFAPERLLDVERDPAAVDDKVAGFAAGLGGDVVFTPRAARGHASALPAFQRLLHHGSGFGHCRTDEDALL